MRINAPVARLWLGTVLCLSLLVILLSCAAHWDGQEGGVAIRESLLRRRAFLEGASVVIGWLYFLAWSASFYPQLILNWERKSTLGLSYDFVWLNFLGFFAYSLFNVAFYSSERVRESYRLANHGEENLVRANDLFFAFHACVVTGLTLIQMYCLGYEQEKGKLVRPIVKGFLICSLIFSCIYLIGVLLNGNPLWDPSASSSRNLWTMLSWLYFVSYIKLVVSFTKYVPQVYMNYVRKSTVGWSITNVCLDFTGGCLSFVQLFIDSSLENDWSGLFGDPVKLGLSLLSLGFDSIFLLQHFYLYNNEASFGDVGEYEESNEEELEPLART